jgi:hypothetical protein
MYKGRAFSSWKSLENHNLVVVTSLIQVIPSNHSITLKLFDNFCNNQMPGMKGAKF